MGNHSKWSWPTDNDKRVRKLFKSANIDAFAKKAKLLIERVE